MGSAMVRGWLRLPNVTSIDVIEPASIDAGGVVRHFGSADSWDVAHGVPDIVVLAVKPQIIDTAAGTLPARVPEHVPVLSIAAGIPLARLASVWGMERPILRAMPNTPAAIGHGVTAYCKNNKIIQKHINTVNSLLECLGTIHQVPDEAMMDAVTALSGSGPAYLYHFTEALEEAGKSIGLPADLAAALARRTVTGAAALMDHDADTSPAALRQAVTSPGGTTAAALTILMGENGNQGLTPLLKEALKAAKNRSEELSKRA